MDLSKLLDISNEVGQSDSILSKNTSILKSLSCIEPSSSVSTVTSFIQTDSDKENLKQLINQVTRQDLILNIINKCIEDNDSCLDPKLRKKIKSIIKFNSFKASFEENNLNEILAVNEKLVDLNSEDGEMKLTKQEAHILNKVVQKCMDKMYTQVILENRSTSTKTSIDRIKELQAKIDAKFHAVESLMKSISDMQDKMTNLSTDEYYKNVIEDNYNIAEMSRDKITKLHSNALITLSQSQVVDPLCNNSKDKFDADTPLPASHLDESITSLEYSIESTESDIEQMEARLSRYRALESGHASVFKSIRKLQNTLRQKRFILKQLVGE